MLCYGDARIFIAPAAAIAILRGCLDRMRCYCMSDVDVHLAASTTYKNSGCRSTIPACALSLPFFHLPSMNSSAVEVCFSAAAGGRLLRRRLPARLKVQAARAAQLPRHHDRCCAQHPLIDGRILLCACSSPAVRCQAQAWRHFGALLKS